ncbi:hypothetical protein [Acinetobacter sp. B51(2017)]|uniref:hypothetical protein n=1 Tax=Acinetobacter sp. B51(2017) TaxID=2060938 RepID=UPI000F084BE1|nr:hypothetical protein [Acinetobacter sp. B51(2017)]
MIIIPSQAAQVLALQAYAAFLDSGSSAAYFMYYSGNKPTSIDVVADSANALCTLTLPKPCLKQVLSDGIELHETNSALATQAGVVTFARLYNGNHEPFADFDVGLIGTHITLNNTNIALGSSQKLESIILNPL